MHKTFIKRFKNDDFACPYCSNGYLNLYHNYEWKGKLLKADDFYFLECPTCSLIYLNARTDEEALIEAENKFKILSKKTSGTTKFYFV
jgi:rubredoxin